MQDAKRVCVCVALPLTRIVVCVRVKQAEGFGAASVGTVAKVTLVRAERSGVRILGRVGDLSLIRNVQTGFVALTASPGVHLSVLSRLTVGGTVPRLPYTPPWRTEATLLQLIANIRMITQSVLFLPVPKSIDQGDRFLIYHVTKNCFLYRCTVHFVETFN